jgi:hypothetical protein
VDLVEAGGGPMTAEDRLTVAEAAELVGVAPATWRAYVARGRAPKPDGRHDKRTPYWFRSTVEGWRLSWSPVPGEWAHPGYGTSARYPTR